MMYVCFSSDKNYLYIISPFKSLNQKCVIIASKLFNIMSSFLYLVVSNILHKLWVVYTYVAELYIPAIYWFVFAQVLRLVLRMEKTTSLCPGSAMTSLPT